MSDLFATTASPSAGAFVPAIDAGEKAQISRAVGAPAFLFMAHPERWVVLGGKIRPAVGRMKLVPGISGVSLGDRGALRVARAKAHYEERGWKVLPHSTLPPKQAHRGSYLAKPEGRPDLTIPYWVSAFPGSAALRCDDALLYEWLDYIVAAGLCPPPALYVLERMRDEARQEWMDRADKAQTVPSYKALAKDAKARLDLIEAEIAARGDGPAPSPSSAASVELE